MCGIVGIGGNLRSEEMQTAVERMNAALTHRGPDDDGSWTGKNFAFGMRRLSIIDLAGGHQPMWDQHSGTGVVYNGEIYNYRGLREKLEKSGVSFNTLSDTEVVLQSLVRGGAEAVHDWNGMFAVARWNTKEKRLLLIRDRMGIKPLYYYWDGSMLVFASELKALLAAGLIQPQLNYQTVWDYLSFRYVPGPETIWQNVWKLPPGHTLEWSVGYEPRVSAYWTNEVESDLETVDFEQREREFERLLLDSVQRRILASDVPVGVFLSGGLDSSSVAAAAVEMGHKNFHTFSVGFSEGGEYSELAYARAVAEHLNTQHHEVVVDRDDFFEMLPEAVRFADEPLADLTIVPLLALSRVARKWVKVVLSGEGSDEILAGYGFDKFARKIKLIRCLKSLPLSVLKGLSKALMPVSGRYGELLYRLASVPLSKWNISNNSHMSRMWTEAEKKYLWPTFNGLDSNRIIKDEYSAVTSEEPLDQVLSVYQKSWLVEDLLMKADKMSMAASLELRVPFLDYRLVQWANRQPDAVKVGGANGAPYATKFVLRRFAQKRLPPSIVQRPKQGFPVPAYSWLQLEKINRWARECLTGRSSRIKPILARSAMNRQLDEAFRGDLYAAHRTWRLLILDIWLREYNVEVEEGAGSNEDARVFPATIQ